MDAVALRRVVLETSLKPFTDVTAAGLRRTCTTLLEQWAPLYQAADTLAILFWTGDGDELLRWSGDFAAPLDWGRWVGFCGLNWDRCPRHPQQPELYCEAPAAITYQHLKDIVATFKHLGRTQFGVAVECGTTIDPGPEFINSVWKLDEHPEVLTGGAGAEPYSTIPFINCTAALHADSRPLAAFPAGIPEGLSFGTLLGRQAAAFCAALDFDYLWLSNGLGFSHYAWYWVGENFDGRQFDRGPFAAESERIVQFWRDWRAAAGDLRCEVRGTNYTVGQDLAAHAIDHAAIYAAGGLTTPPINPPWGSVDLGLEMAAYLSRIAVLPGETFDFRCYLNDPWFWTNPWWDYYHREPFDLYCPLTCSRLDATGATQTPSSVALLTVDTERGELNPDTALEVIPHLRHALRYRPTAPGPLIWLYPYDELRAGAASAEGQAFAWFHDVFVRSAIGQGLPLNTVVSSRDLATVPSGTLAGNVLLAALPRAGAGYVERLLELIDEGLLVLFYGPEGGADPAILDLLGLALDAPLEGDLTLDGEPLRHQSALSAGPIRAVAGAGAVVRATVRQGATERAYAVRRGAVAWVRGSSPVTIEPGQTTARAWRADESVDASVWLRRLLGDLGLTADQTVGPGGRAGMLFISRHDHGWQFVGHKPDATTTWHLALRDGVPVCTELQTRIDDGAGGYTFDRSFHRECRVFVRQAAGLVGCKELQHPPGTHRRLQVTGLDEAVVTVYPPRELAEVAVIDGADAVICDEERGVILAFGCSGTITVTW